MKIILTTTSPNIDSEIDPRFGRGATLLVVDTDTMQSEAHSNPGVTASGGAGIRPVVTDIASVDEAVMAYVEGNIVDQVERLH